MSTSIPAVSVVVPTYQRRALLHQLLVALARQTAARGQFEVIVVVDGSDDGTCEMLEGFEASYDLSWSWRPNGGRAAACNAGVIRARGELIVLLDDDMEPVPSFVEAHIAANPPPQRRAVMGAAPMVPTAPASAVVGYVARKFNRHLERLATPGRPLGLRDFYSGNLSIPRAVLLEIGGFDEDFTTYGHEDVELSCRLKQAGVEIAFSGAPIAYQHYDKSFRALASDNVSKGRTAVLMAAKHPRARHELKLASLELLPARRRLLLHALVRLTRKWPAAHEHVIRLTSAAGRWHVRGFESVCAIVLDYCFLLGVGEAEDAAARRTVVLS